jgi:hypothetical protein
MLENVSIIATEEDRKPETIREFLASLYGEEPLGDLARNIPLGYWTVWTLPDRRTHWVSTLTRSRVALRAQALAPTQDVYFGVGIRRERLDIYQRGGADNVVALPALFLDLDIRHRVHACRNLPPNRDAARRLLDDFPLPPSLLIDSGHGFQVYWVFTELWRFDTPDERWEAQLLVRRLQATFQEMARRKGWAVDSTFNLGQLLRLPGTTNRKEPRAPVPVQVERCDPARRYRPIDFEPHVLSSDELIRTVQRRRAPALSKDLPPVDVDSLAISERMRTVIRLGQDLLIPERYPTRSEAVSGVVTAMVAANYGDDAIARVLLDADNGISAKPRGKGVAWLAQEIARVRAKVEALDAGGPLGAPAAERVKPFPLQVFPKPLIRYAQAVANATPVAVDFVGVPMLAVAAAAVGNSRAVAIKANDWEEGARLYCALVGETGEKKTPTLKRVLQPVYRAQQALMAEYQAAQTRYQLEVKRYKVAQRGWEVEQKKAPGGTAAPPQEPTPPVARQLYTTDTTNEAMGELLATNPRSLLLVCDELIGWVHRMNQYRGGRGADRQNFLSVWSGEPWMANRKGQPTPTFVESPFLCVVGGLPPDLLHALADSYGREDGFVERILWCYPEALPESWSALSVPADVAAVWEDTLQRLGQLAPASQEVGACRPVVVNLTPAARAAFARFCAAHDGELTHPRFPPSLKGTWHKMVTYGGRLALLLHELRRVCGEAETEDVDETSVLGAWALVDYFKSQARRVHRQMHQPLRAKRLERRAEAVVHWLNSHGGRCTARDLQKRNVGGIRFVSEADSVLNFLEDSGRGHYEMQETPQGRGSKWKAFILTP